VATSFHAEYVKATKQDWGCQVVWSVDDDLAAQVYLMVQQVDAPTQDDIRLGMTGVYIEFCDEAWSCYGHMLTFELCRDRVWLQLDAETAIEMHDDGRVEVTFDLCVERFAELRSVLSQTFRGYDYYKDTAV
jgi:Immunity protein 10